MSDLRQAIRALVKSPGYAAVTMCSLAVSIGASTALFSVADAVLFRTLPVENPERLVLIKLGGWGDSAPYRLVESLTAGSRDVLDSVAAYGTRSVTVSESGTPERIDAAFVSGAFSSTVGISAAHGRVLTDQDERDASSGGVVISNGLWQRRFGSDPSVLGQVLRINDHGFPVVGVLPAGFFGTDVGRSIDVYLPVTAAAPLGSIGSGTDDRLFVHLAATCRPTALRCRD